MSDGNVSYDKFEYNKDKFVEILNRPAARIIQEKIFFILYQCIVRKRTCRQILALYLLYDFRHR